jgi:hypothetical protein
MKSSGKDDFVSQTARIVSQFNKISQAYDETREPLKEAAVAKIGNIFLRDNCSSILDSGGWHRPSC